MRQASWALPAGVLLTLQLWMHQPTPGVASQSLIEHAWMVTARTGGLWALGIALATFASGVDQAWPLVRTHRLARPTAGRPKQALMWACGFVLLAPLVNALTWNQALLTLTALLPAYDHMSGGLRAVDPGLIEMTRACDLDLTRTLFDSLWKGAWPSTLAGWRWSLVIVWSLQAFVSMFETTSLGLGLWFCLSYIGCGVICLLLLSFARPGWTRTALS